MGYNNRRALSFGLSSLSGLVITANGLASGETVFVVTGMMLFLIAAALLVYLIRVN